jgi:hypothetical protein
MAGVSSGTLVPDWENVVPPEINMLLGRRAFPLNWFCKRSGPKSGVKTSGL